MSFYFFEPRYFYRFLGVILPKLDQIKSEIVKKIHEIENKQDELKSLVSDFLFEFEAQKQQDKKILSSIKDMSKLLGVGNA